MEQTVKVVIAYIDARPARLHEHFATLASEALKEAFPINNIQLRPLSRSQKQNFSSLLEPYCLSSYSHDFPPSLTNETRSVLDSRRRVVHTAPAPRR
jgi:hypothetical protein